MDNFCTACDTEIRPDDQFFMDSQEPPNYQHVECPKLYMMFEHDGSLGPRETEYLGPFRNAGEAMAHCLVWGGLHGEPTTLAAAPPSELTYSPRAWAKHQEHRF